MTEERDLILANCAVLDVISGELVGGREIQIVGDRIRDIRPCGRRSRVHDGNIIDLRGQTVMPGLIDAHVHVIASDLDLACLPRQPATLLVARSLAIMRDMLLRGFTTARDAGGADWGLAEAVRTGLLMGPRLFIAGRGIAQTGGQGDFRARNEAQAPNYRTNAVGPLTRIANGVDEVRFAVRDELRRGADHIKMFVGGGVASNIPLENSHYSVPEIQAACEEAAAAGTYVMAHAYAPDSILRAVDAGVRTVEHGNLMTRSAANAISGRAFIVPTLSALKARLNYADRLNLSQCHQADLIQLVQAGLRSIEHSLHAGLEVGLGTDLEGILHPHQMLEMELRGEIQEPLEIIRSATATNAKILRMEHLLGAVAPDMLADLLVVQENPSENIELLTREGGVSGVIKGGRVIRYDMVG